MAILSLASLALGLASLTSALPSAAPHKRYVETVNDIKYDVFEPAHLDAKMSYVSNSGICETTPGVNQTSGYFTVGTGSNMFFWFFAARSAPTTAPLAMWLNGGPGCSSLIGLFQENGPCHFTGSATTPSLNPYSWNNYANMLYVDSPIGAGFSYGTDGATSTLTAAPYVWNLLQAFYAAFPQYESREFGLWTESYGGHYGPEFALYFEQQNAAIAAGTITGEKVNLVALGVNNGLIDPLIQYKAYLDFAANNTYRKLITPAQYATSLSKYNSQCVPAYASCKSTSGNNQQCLNAQNTCEGITEDPIEQANDFDVYDVRAPSNDPNPPENYMTYLQSAAVMKAIGAQGTYQECGDAPFNKIINTGDEARNFAPALQSVVQSGVNVVIWAGDADWICNWYGSFAVVNEISYSQSSAFQSAALKTYTVNGASAGAYKSAGNFNFLRVTGAGHEVPYYQPQTALQVFTQIMQGKPLTST